MKEAYATFDTAKEEYKVQSAVLLIIYNRPDVTEKVFQSIRSVAPARLYIAADGPNPSKQADEELCGKARAVAGGVDWPCEVKTLFSAVNQGCKSGVIAAINWFFATEEEGIILEDDCVAAPSFFRFCDIMLSRYRYDERIATITGTNLQQGKKWGKDSYYFSRFSNVWGWATWRRFWKKYDGSLGRFYELDPEKEMVKVFRDPFLSEEWVRIYNKLRNNEIDTWDYQLQFTVFFENCLCATPNVNLVSNIGFRADATHTNNPEHHFHANLPLENLETITHPLSFLPEEKADDYFLHKEFYIEEKWRQFHKNKTYRRRFKRWIRSFLK